MTRLALVSAKGSPGVTTTAVLLAAVWPRPALLVEADPAGGDLRSWYHDEDGRPLDPGLGLVGLLTHATLTADTRTHSPDNSLNNGPTGRPAGAGAAGATGAAGGSVLSRWAQTLPGGLPVVVGVDNPTQTAALTGSWQHHLPAALTGHDGDVVVDLGRLAVADLSGPPHHDGPSASVLGACDVTAVVCQATVSSLSHARDLLQRLPARHLPAVLLLRGETADVPDAAAAVGLDPTRVLRLPDSPRAAEALRSVWNRRLDRSDLVAAARTAAGTLAGLPTLHRDRTEPPREAPGPSRPVTAGPSRAVHAAMPALPGTPVNQPGPSSVLDDAPRWSHSASRPVPLPAPAAPATARADA